MPSRAKKKATTVRRRKAEEVLRWVNIMRRQGANFPRVWMRGDGKLFLDGKFLPPTTVHELLAKKAA